MEDNRRLRRREVIAAAGGLFGTTGCLGNVASNRTDGGDEESDGGANETDQDADFAVEPVEYPDRSCDVCARNVTEYPRWNAQAVHNDGERAFFCTSGCMGAYYTSPSSFGVSEAEIAGLWVTDYGTRETVDGFNSYYVFVGERGLIEMPAGRNPVPFATQERAEEFTRRFEELSTGDAERFSKVNLNRCVW
jgi:nitrous oxide reductase accessory protein NosL